MDSNSMADHYGYNGRCPGPGEGLGLVVERDGGLVLSPTSVAQRAYSNSTIQEGPTTCSLPLNFFQPQRRELRGYAVDMLFPRIFKLFAYVMGEVPADVFEDIQKDVRELGRKFVSFNSEGLKHRIQELRKGKERSREGVGVGGMGAEAVYFSTRLQGVKPLDSKERERFNLNMEGWNGLFE
ncbi:hypothetical protein L2E82_45611 [Cichorium intybus]|uniref:Uncharacterized protein n=1 Tax=Cichorium intybus TaxID=13427 RepID=A0ACB8ZTH5_CICIN|nr:hypothetical protein L2E82_45611 [Cichorium intybus]